MRKEVPSLHFSVFWGFLSTPRKNAAPAVAVLLFRCSLTSNIWASRPHPGHCHPHSQLQLPKTLETLFLSDHPDFALLPFIPVVPAPVMRWQARLFWPFCKSRWMAIIHLLKGRVFVSLEPSMNSWIQHQQEECFQDCLRVWPSWTGGLGWSGFALMDYNYAFLHCSIGHK